MPKWTQDCAAQLKLEELFRNGSISNDTKPCELKQKYQEFNVFQPQIFRAHFNQTRAKMGLLCE